MEVHSAVQSPALYEPRIYIIPAFVNTKRLPRRTCSFCMIPKGFCTVSKCNKRYVTYSKRLISHEGTLWNRIDVIQRGL